MGQDQIDDQPVERNAASVRDAVAIPWIEPPGHHGGLSKVLVSPDTHDTKYFDFRVSRYPVGARVEAHTHDEAEHVYYFLSGTGLITHGESEHVARPETVMFVAPRVEHSVMNTGSSDLVFVVATSPPSDISREDSRS